MAGCLTHLCQPFTAARVAQREPGPVEGTHKLTPTTLTGKLAGAAALGGAATAAPLALLDTLVGQLLRKQKV